MKKLSIIIPVYNEEKTIAKAIDSVLGIQLPGWQKEIIIVNDGSSDTTGEILASLKRKVQVIHKKVNEGKGSALQAGFKAADGDIVLVQDADLEYSPNDYPILLAPFENDQVDIVYGSRFLGAHLSTMFVYELGNKFVTLITNILFNTNITDMETGFKVFRKAVLRDITVTAKRFDVEPEITAKVLKKGYQIYEVPISYFGRTFSDGKKLTWRDGIVAFWTLIKLRLTS